MKDYLAQQVASAQTAIHGRNLVREYLQARILGGLQRAGAMIPLAFQGGTCLRFLYSIPRFSEDLDFALERPEAPYDLRALLRSLRAELAAEGYVVELRVNDRRVVHSGLVRFAGLLHELGLSPASGGSALHPRRGRHPAAFRGRPGHHAHPPPRHPSAAAPRPGLAVGGQLHAVLQRPWPKGRDFYDLLWYLSDPDWPAPNLVLLDNALQQSGWKGDRPAQRTWRRIVRHRLRTVDWDRLKADVGPFLEPGAETDLMTRENLELVLGREP